MQCAVSDPCSDGLNESCHSWKVVKNIEKRLKEFKHRDRLSNVDVGSVQNISNIEKRCRDLRTIVSFEEIDATDYSGGACCDKTTDD